MKFKGKIVQIIKEEDKNYGLPKLKNTDWLNIRPIPELKNKSHLLFGGLFVLGFLLAFVLTTYINQWVGLIPIILCWGFGMYLMWKESKDNKKILPTGWYFDAPVPVEKPHNFEVGQEITIELKIGEDKFLIEDIKEVRIQLLEEEIIKLKEETLQLMSGRNIGR